MSTIEKTYAPSLSPGGLAQEAFAKRLAASKRSALRQVCVQLVGEAKVGPERGGHKELQAGLVLHLSLKEQAHRRRCQAAWHKDGPQR